MDRTISQGMTGQDVRSLQDVLNFHIRRGAPLVVDGVFGPKTEARVREFQKANGLKVDGLVGPKTKALLYELYDVNLTLFFLPKLQMPKLGQSGNRGLQPPQLIPPLQFPGSPLGLGGTFRLFPDSLTLLPDLTGPTNALNLKITVPARKDPDDPFLRSRAAIVQLIDDLPVDSKFKAFLISQVPNPVSKISPPDTGFKWGLSPLFNPLDPKGFGAKGNAQFLLRLTGGRNGQPNIAFGAWGDGKLFLDFATKQGEARPKVEAQGQVFLGLKGTF